jgi:hypothetical protein
VPAAKQQIEEYFEIKISVLIRRNTPGVSMFYGAQTLDLAAATLRDLMAFTKQVEEALDSESPSVSLYERARDQAMSLLSAILSPEHARELYSLVDEEQIALFEAGKPVDDSLEYYKALVRSPLHSVHFCDKIAQKWMEPYSGISYFSGADGGVDYGDIRIFLWSFDDNAPTSMIIDRYKPTRVGRTMFKNHWQHRKGGLKGYYCNVEKWARALQAWNRGQFDLPPGA